MDVFDSLRHEDSAKPVEELDQSWFHAIQPEDEDQQVDLGGRGGHGEIFVLRVPTVGVVVERACDAEHLELVEEEDPVHPEDNGVRRGVIKHEGAQHHGERQHGQSSQQVIRLQGSKPGARNGRRLDGAQGGHGNPWDGRWARHKAGHDLTT